MTKVCSRPLSYPDDSPLGQPKAETAAPFGEAALQLCRQGLAVIPVGGADGKMPLIEWGRWRRPPGEDFVRKLASRFPTANVGTVCRLSNVTVVDIDDPNNVVAMITRYGDTPVKIRTPSGGVHPWYRHNGERCVNLRRSEGLPVDIKGAGGFVVVPPSIRPAGPHARKRYRLMTGSWEDLKSLPTMRVGKVTRSETKAVALRAVKEGHRNDMLFKMLLRHAEVDPDFGTSGLI